MQIPARVASLATKCRSNGARAARVLRRRRRPLSPRRPASSEGEPSAKAALREDEKKSRSLEAPGVEGENAVGAAVQRFRARFTVGMNTAKRKTQNATQKATQPNSLNECSIFMFFAPLFSLVLVLASARAGSLALASITAIFSKFFYRTTPMARVKMSLF